MTHHSQSMTQTLNSSHRLVHALFFHFLLPLPRSSSMNEKFPFPCMPAAHFSSISNRREITMRHWSVISMIEAKSKQGLLVAVPHRARRNVSFFPQLATFLPNASPSPTSDETSGIMVFVCLAFNSSGKTGKHMQHHKPQCTYVDS